MSEPKPLDMLLYCPACGIQHIDEATANWENPPHRSHLCGRCGFIWRPADVPTNGVASITTRGAADCAPFLAPALRQRAMDFHRRAQKAEGLEKRARRETLTWFEAWQRTAANRRTLKRKLNRIRALLQAARWADPITRIIEIGRMFP